MSASNESSSSISPAKFDGVTTPLPYVPPRAAKPPWPEDQVLIIPAAAASSHAGFRQWVTSGDGPRYGRWSFVNGEIIADMSPEYFDSHLDVKGEAYATLRRLAGELGIGMVVTDGLLVSNETAQLSSEPDVTYVSWDTLDSGRARFVPGQGRPGDTMELLGSPDLVLEVVSGSSQWKDTKRLRVSYHLASIPEYWLIDARREDDIRFDILRHGPDGYEPVPIEDGWVTSAVFGRRFKLDWERNRAGRLCFTLRHEPIPPA